MQMPFAITAISFWRSYYNANDFCGSWFGENYIENALSRESCFFVLKHSLVTNHGCAHNGQLSTCTIDDKLIAALGASYVTLAYQISDESIFLETCFVSFL